jgi:hypothetical protein
LLVGVLAYVVGALLLRPVDERRREDLPLITEAVETVPATA